MHSYIKFDTTLSVIYAVLGTLIVVFYVAALRIRRRVWRSGEPEPLLAFRLRRLTLLTTATLFLLAMAVPVVGAPLNWYFYFLMGAIIGGGLGMAVVRSMDE